MLSKHRPTAGRRFAPCAGYLNAVERSKRIEKRFHELAIKSAEGKTTLEEEKKLDRYQALRRPRRTAAEIRAEAEWCYKIDKLFKLARACIRREREHLDNIAHERPAE